jgi:hypothetical protein
MELWVFSDRQLNSIAEWQAAIEAERYSLDLHNDAAALMRNNAGFDFGHDWKYALGFRWLGSKQSETLAAWMAGTAYARATAGIVINDQDSRLRTAAESAEVVRDIESPSQAYEEARRELRRWRGLET